MISHIPLTPSQSIEFEPLFIALLGAVTVDAMVPLCAAKVLLPLNVAEELVTADPARACRMCKWLASITDANGEWEGDDLFEDGGSQKDLFQKAIDILRSMLARIKAKNIVAEIDGNKLFNSLDTAAYAHILTGAPAYCALSKSKRLRLEFAFRNASSVEVRDRDGSADYHTGVKAIPAYVPKHLVFSERGVQHLCVSELRPWDGTSIEIFIRDTDVVGDCIATDEIHAAVSAMAKRGSAVLGSSKGFAAVKKAEAELQAVVDRHYYKYHHLLWAIGAAERAETDYE